MNMTTNNDASHRILSCHGASLSSTGPAAPPRIATVSRPFGSGKTMGSILEPDPPTWSERITEADKDRGDVMTNSLEAAPEGKPRDARAVRKVHQRWLERRSVRLGGALDGVERFMVMGTAGGAAASLAVAAAIIGSGDTASPSNSTSCWWSS